MYEDYTHQALPERSYRLMLGTALCVFASNNGFVIENILRNDSADAYNWHDLIDETSGNLANPIKKTITARADNEIAQLFDEIVQMRNRILHGFQITDSDYAQKLATKDKKTQKQFVITEEYLMSFIEKNDALSSKLHDLRGW